MKRPFLYCLALTLHLAFFTPPSLALEATGQGVNTRQAVNDALRRAVEMSLGVTIENNTLVENFQVVRSQLLSHTKGFVRSYKVMHEERLPSGAYSVTIDADVDETSIKDSTLALATLMKMAAHPRVLVAAIDDDFDALSSLNDEFRLLSESVEATLRDDFSFDVIDSESARLNDPQNYRYSDRKNNLKRARQIGADYVVFVQLLKGRDRPYSLRLESVETHSARSLAKEEVGFAMENWTNHLQRNRNSVMEEAKAHVYAPSAQLAAAMVETIRKEVYEDGKRFELSFQRFDEKTIQYLESDLAALSGYVRHKTNIQKKNVLTLSYWSLLEPAILNEAISNQFKSQEVTFDFTINGQTLSYRFKDPMFE